jgi:hypothetical protein
VQELAAWELVVEEALVVDHILRSTHRLYQ